MWNYEMWRLVVTIKKTLNKKVKYYSKEWTDSYGWPKVMDDHGWLKI